MLGIFSSERSLPLSTFLAGFNLTCSERRLQNPTKGNTEAMILNMVTKFFPLHIWWNLKFSSISSFFPTCKTMAGCLEASVSHSSSEMGHPGFMQNTRQTKMPECDGNQKLKGSSRGPTLEFGSGKLIQGSE
ncbi:unnamed protein product [Pleuronectes platessa]|uniref:Uncharacterized protein n=1 Tax=Pleuronectes platessa TaxID=8262 RepID=A0A9N7UQ52_PLEPL|nr:unnamed protein product [Pleuronectes platessa]